MLRSKAVAHWKPSNLITNLVYLGLGNDTFDPFIYFSKIRDKSDSLILLWDDEAWSYPL